MTVDAGIVQAVVIVLGLFAVLMVCSLFKSRPTADALSPAQLDDIRIRRECEKEALLEDKAQCLQERARIHRHNRLLLTARKDTGLLMRDAQEQWDARGRAIYGDAWDQPDDGNMPLRSLFNLPKQEIDSIRDEARRLVEGRAWGAEWSALSDSQSTPPAQDANTDDRRARRASARRGSASSRPSPDAPYVDERFIYTATPPSIVPPLDFSRLRSSADYLPVAKYFQHEPRPSEPTPLSFSEANQLAGVQNNDAQPGWQAGDGWQNPRLLGRGVAHAKSRTMAEQ